MQKVIAGTLVVIGVGIVFLFLPKDKVSNAVTTSATTTKAALVVESQNATSTVHITSVTLSQPGFLAVREVDSGRLGQIVEISRYLTIGTHTDIQISLGDFYEGGGELIVMAYKDIGDDKSFNDLDQPLEIEGIPLSVYVATGIPVPASITTNSANANGPTPKIETPPLETLGIQ